jgi:hypothetical protein
MTAPCVSCSGCESMKKPFTVFAVREDDTDQRYVTYIEALNPQEAEKKAVREAKSPIIIASVVEGRVKPADRVSDLSVSPIRGRGYETAVARLAIEFVRVRFPLVCPKCKADLRKPDSLFQWDFSDKIWHARMPRGEYKAEKGHVGVTLNRDLGAHQSLDGGLVAVAVVVQCVKCNYALWDGVHEKRSDDVA